MNRATSCLALSCLLLGNWLPAPASGDTAAGSVLWTYDVGDQIWTPLALEAGVLFFGDDGGTLHALDIATRQPRWRFQTSGRIRSAATVAGGSVLFASDDGFLYAVDRKSGKERWKLDLGSSGLERWLPASGPPYVYDYLHSSPTVEDGTVYVGSADKELYAVDAESGRGRWSFAARGAIRSSPAVSEGAVYFGSWDGSVYAVSAESGKEVWSYETGAPIQGSPAVVGGRVIVGSRSARVLALDASSGEVEWTYALADGSWVESSPVVRGDIVYVGSSDALALFALDARSGAEVWRFKTGGWSWGTPVVTDEVVYIGSISAFPYYFSGVDLVAGFFAVDRQTGEERWRMTPEAVEGYVTGGVFAAPAIDAGIVYVASLDGRIHAIRE
jgi:outer membrane protein assembly factor BamB